MLLRSAALAMFILFEVLLVIPMTDDKKALACSCAGPKPTSEVYQDSDAVFVGRATDIRNQDRFNIVQFDIGMAWKGVSDSRVLVKTADSGSMCGYGFDLGRDYLVYAYNGSSDYLSTSGCGRTQPFETAFSDLAYLGPGFIPAPGQQVVEEPSGLWFLMLLIGAAVGAVAFIALRRTRN